MKGLNLQGNCLYATTFSRKNPCQQLTKHNVVWSIAMNVLLVHFAVINLKKQRRNAKNHYNVYVPPITY